MHMQKEEMTPGERMREYQAGREVDYLPYSLLSCDQALAEVFGYTTGMVGRDFELMAEVIRRKRDEFGMDGLHVGLGLRTVGAALGSKLHVPEHGIDHVKEYVLTDYQGFDRLEIVDPYKNPTLSKRLETAKKLRERFPEMALSTGVAGPISTAAAMRPAENILRDTRRNPQMLKKLLDLAVDSSLKWVEVFCREFGAVDVSLSDPVTCMDVLSKKQFDEFSYPYLKKLTEGIKKITGSTPGAHICGKTKPIWEELKALGLSGFSIDNCEDLTEAKSVLGEAMMLMGNVPPVDVMREGTVEEVEAACKVCISKCGDSPMGFQLDTGCQLPIGTKRENIEAFIAAVKRYGRGAKKGCLPKGLAGGQ